MHVTLVVRWKEISYVRSKTKIDIFLIEDAWVITIVELENGTERIRT